jgi:hypothetical protein
MCRPCFSEMIHEYSKFNEKSKKSKSLFMFRVGRPYLDLIDRHLRKCKAGGPGEVVECKEGKKVQRKGPTGKPKGKVKGKKYGKKVKEKAVKQARRIESESD